MKTLIQYFTAEKSKVFPPNENLLPLPYTPSVTYSNQPVNISTCLHILVSLEDDHQQLDSVRHISSGTILGWEEPTKEPYLQMFVTYYHFSRGLSWTTSQNNQLRLKWLNHPQWLLEAGSDTSPSFNDLNLTPNLLDIFAPMVVVTTTVRQCKEREREREPTNTGSVKTFIIFNATNGY